MIYGSVITAYLWYDPIITSKYCYDVTKLNNKWGHASISKKAMGASKPHPALYLTYNDVLEYVRVVVRPSAHPAPALSPAGVSI